MVSVQPFQPGGTVICPPSKSDTHRLLILSALCEGETITEHPLFCGDTLATADCLRALGARIEPENGAVRVRGIQRVSGVPRLNAGLSGSTLRFLLPVACALYDRVTFTAEEGLKGRPLSPLLDCLRRFGVAFDSDTPPLTSRGLLKPGIYRADGSVSSQYVTGLLLAAPLTGGRVEIGPDPVSRPYIDLTLMRQSLFLKNGRYVSPGTVRAEGDWSTAAVLLSAGALSDTGVTVSGLDPESPQGDRAILRILADLGARVTWNGDSVTVRRGRPECIKADLSHTPDLIAPAAFLACAARGESVLSGCERLKYKECDRADCICRMINDLGGEARSENGSLYIRGGSLKGGTALCRGDHRMVMAASLMGMLAPVTLDSADAVGKSCPDFFALYRRLGGKLYGI